MASSLFNLQGKNFNIEAVCPSYLPESQWSFTWYRDEDGAAIVDGYDPEYDEAAWWMCGVCGDFITDGSCHCSCGSESPWGCDCSHLDNWDEEEDYYHYENGLLFD